MHFKKISIMAIAALMGISMVSNKTYAKESVEELYDKILNEQIAEEQKEAEEGKKVKLPKTVVYLPKSEKEVKKLMVDENKELAEEAKNESATWGALQKPKFERTITNYDTEVIGVTTPNTKVMLTLNCDGVKYKFKVVSDDEGLFGVIVPLGGLTEGMKIEAYAYQGDKKSAVASTTVVRGLVNAPAVAEVTTHSDYLTGATQDFHATAYAEINGKVYECGSVDNDGYFTINIPRQKAGTKIAVYTISSNGEKSPVCNTMVIQGFGFENIDKVATNTKVIKGKTRPFAMVQYTTPNDDMITSADAKGNFEFKVGEKLPKGKNIVFLALDINNGILSEELVKPIYTAPSKPKVSNKKITVSTTKVSGTATKGYTAYVKAGSKYYKSKVDNSGKFTVTIPKQKKGTSIKIYIKGTNGVNSNVVAFKVLSSATAPSEPTISTVVSTSTTTVKGKGERGTTATVRIGNKYYKSTVKSNGEFAIKIPKQKKNTVIKIYLKNKKGEYSPIIAKKVIQAPKAPKNLKFWNEDGAKVATGVVGKNVAVYSKVEGSNVWHRGYVMYEDDKSCEFMIDCPGMKVGSKVKFFSKNPKTGATSEVITVKVDKIVKL